MRLTVAITGASGAVFAKRLLLALEENPAVERVDCVISENALRVFAEELGVSGRTACLEKLLGRAPGKTRQFAESDIGAGIASGSYPSAGMIVLPCSMGTLSAIAHGAAQNLVSRAADVCLKERRRLVLCVRETPFNRIHLRNMLLADEAGAVIFPVIPSFYNHPQTVEEMATQFAARVLQLFGLEPEAMYRWQED